MDEFDKSVVQAMFPKHAKGNIDTYFPLIEAAYAEQAKKNKELSDSDHRSLKLYIYATIRAETGSFSPKNEGISKYNSYTLPDLEPVYDRHHHLVRLKVHQRIVDVPMLNRPFQRYEDGGQVAKLGNTHYGDGAKFKGRGFIQLTGRDNYKKYSTYVRGLEANPELAEKPENAAKLVVAYVLENKKRILKSLEKSNLTEARIVVNGRPKNGALPNGLHEFSTAYQLGGKLTAPKAASSTPTPKAAASPTPAPKATPVSIRKP